MGYVDGPETGDQVNELEAALTARDEAQDLAERAARAHQMMLNDLLNIARFLGVEANMGAVVSRLNDLVKAEQELAELRDKLRLLLLSDK